MPAKPHHGPLDLEKVEQLAAQGLTQEQIAHCLGFTARTLQRKKNAESEVSEAIRRGQAKGVALVTNKLFELCRSGNLGAICFYMKTRGGWSEKHSVEHSGPDQGAIRIERVIIRPDGDANTDQDA